MEIFAGILTLSLLVLEHFEIVIIIGHVELLCHHFGEVLCCHRRCYSNALVAAIDCKYTHDFLESR